jgi:hypothetical protein
MRRIISVLAVVAVMAAMVVATAGPAFAQAVVTPKQCTPVSTTTEQCFHLTTTPSGNKNSHSTTETSDPLTNTRFHGNNHIKPTK